MFAVRPTAVLLVVIVTLPARGEEIDPGQAFTLAESAFEYQDYRKTVSLLEPLLLPKPLLEGARLRRAWEHFGTSHWWLGGKQRFNQAMTAWLVLDPAAELDSFFYPPEMIRDFDALKKSLLSMGVIQAPGETPGPRKDQVLVIERTRVEHPPAVAWVPFGAGQFATGRYGMGSLFLIAEAASIGANVGAWGWMEAHRDGRGRDAAIVTMYTSLGAFIAFAVWGALDARLRWKTVEEFEQRRYEARPPDGPAPEPGPAPVGGNDRWHP